MFSRNIRHISAKIVFYMKKNAQGSTSGRDYSHAFVKLVFNCSKYHSFHPKNFDCDLSFVLRMLRILLCNFHKEPKMGTILHMPICLSGRHVFLGMHRIPRFIIRRKRHDGLRIRTVPAIHCPDVNLEFSSRVICVVVRKHRV